MLKCQLEIKHKHLSMLFTKTLSKSLNSYIKLSRCGIIANETTIQQSPNDLDLRDL